LTERRLLLPFVCAFVVGTSEADRLSGSVLRRIVGLLRDGEDGLKRRRLLLEGGVLCFDGGGVIVT
jgi:hypothetical protein